MIFHFDHLQNVIKYFQKKDTVKSLLQKWIIYHPHVITYPITNDYITVNFYGVINGLKTEIRQKVLLQFYVRELHTDMKKDVTGFFMA